MCQNCNAMQNTEGQEIWCEWLRGKGREVKTTAKYVQFDAWARPKGAMLKRSRVNGSKCKTAY